MYEVDILSVTGARPSFFDLANGEKKLGGTSMAQTSRRQETRKIASLGLAAWVLLLPIALVSLGIWQTQRAAETLEHARRSSAELSTTLAQVKNIAASDPTAILTFQGAGEPTLPPWSPFRKSRKPFLKPTRSWKSRRSAGHWFGERSAEPYLRFSAVRWD
nr:hypothetical protein [Rhizobium leguminosarum]